MGEIGGEKGGQKVKHLIEEGEEQESGARTGAKQNYPKGKIAKVNLDL